MIRTGDTIHNPVTGERITFHASRPIRTANPS